MDALGFAAGDPNQFRYVGDDVLDEVDPSGKMPYRYPIDSRIAGQLISSLWDYFFPQPPQPLGPNGTATPQQFLQSDMLPVQSDATVNLLRGGCVDLLKWRYGLDGPPELSPNTVLYKDWESMYKAWQGLEGKGFYYRTMLIHMSNQLTDKDYARMLKDAAHGIMDPVKTYFAVRSSASYNFASLRVTGDPKTPVFYWEWMNHSLMSNPWRRTAADQTSYHHAWFWFWYKYLWDSKCSLAGCWRGPRINLGYQWKCRDLPVPGRFAGLVFAQSRLSSETTHSRRFGRGHVLPHAVVQTGLFNMILSIEGCHGIMKAPAVVSPRPLSILLRECGRFNQRHFSPSTPYSTVKLLTRGHSLARLGAVKTILNQRASRLR